MCPQPPGGTGPLNVPATPQDALPQDALSNTAQALPQTAIGNEKENAAVVMVAVWSAKGGTAEVYFAQVHGGASDDIYYMSSVQTLIDMLDDFESIEHLVILAHSFDDSVLFGRTAAQLTKDLAPVMPRVSKLTLDGCTAGRKPVELYDMAVAFRLTELSAWTYFHHIEVWGRPEEKPDPNENLAAVLEFAAPYVPRGASGASTPASQLQAWFDSNGTFTVATEFFTYNLDDHLTFETLTDRVTHPGPTGPPMPDPWTRVRTPSEAQFPRSAVERLEIASRAAAEAAASTVQAMEATPYRIVIRP
jgi:hypothetical protein